MRIINSVAARDVRDQSRDRDQKSSLYRDYDRDQRLNPRLYNDFNFVSFQVMFLYIINHLIIVILISCNTKKKNTKTRDMLNQAAPDSGLDHWNRYQSVDLEKTVKTGSQVYSKILYGFNAIS